MSEDNNEKTKKFNEEIAKELFFNQMNDFKNETSSEIIKILDDKKYMLETEVLGLIATAKSLTLVDGHNKEAKDALLDTAIYMLQQGKEK